jgi:hypothetical protein
VKKERLPMSVRESKEELETPKKPYVQPKLKVLGKVRDLTLAAAAGSVVDGINRMAVM